MIEWNYIVISVSVLLLFLLLGKEVSRKNKVRLGVRIFATLIAVTSLACMAIPILYSAKEVTSINNEAVLLTDGYNRDSINRFLSISNHVPVFTTDQNLKDASSYNALFFPDIQLLLQKNENINTLNVFGYGLNKDELDELKNKKVVFHPSANPGGITDINWQRQIKSGDKLYVQGTFNNSSSSKAKIILSNFNITLDSVSFSAGKSGEFELTTIPKNADRTVYSLAVIVDGDTIEKELLPVQIEQGEPLKILMIAASPDFENKFLQNYLSQNSYPVAARTAISKNMFVKSFLNSSTLPLDRITSSLLDKFDVTIADAAELASISKAELSIIQTQVAQKGMGLIIKADSANNSTFYTSRFPLITMATNAQSKLSVYLLDSSNNMPFINNENGLSIRKQRGTQPLVLDKQNRLFTNSTLYGSGKILLTTLTNTFNWSLSGDQKAYETFWSTLLNKVAPKQVADEVWSISPALPEIDKPTQLQVETNKSIIPQGQVNGASVYLKQDYDLPYRWSGNYYSSKAGWHSAIEVNGNIFYWYSYSKENWKALKALQKTKATQCFILNNNNINNKREIVEKTAPMEVPRVIFLLLFLLASAFLWLEEKKLFPSWE